MNQSIEQNAESLVALLSGYQRIAVAFSGGVDSSVVAAACQKAGLEFVCAVTAQSPSVPAWQLETAVKVASEIGITHHVVQTRELENLEYQRNDSNRCFYCKDTLYASIAEVLGKVVDDHEHEVTVASGTNYDDLGDHRPGIMAGNQRQVATPLAELEFGKQQVRDLARYFSLSNHDLPAAPCLASRIAYGVEVTQQRLRQIEQGETWLRDHGISECRVRLHQDGVARIEVPRNLLQSIVKLESEGELVNQFQQFGFKFVTLDLEGFQSGKLNRVIVPLELPKPRRRKGNLINE